MNPAPDAGAPGSAELQGRHLLLGVTGGVAAFKACEFARELQRRGATVQVVMTDAARQFIGEATFQALTGRPVYSNAWDGRIANGMPHIDLSREADAVVIVPASADFMAKVALGLADDLLSTLVLARDCPSYGTGPTDPLAAAELVRGPETEHLLALAGL